MYVNIMPHCHTEAKHFLNDLCSFYVLINGVVVNPYFTSHQILQQNSLILFTCKWISHTKTIIINIIFYSSRSVCVRLFSLYLNLTLSTKSEILDVKISFRHSTFSTLRFEPSMHIHFAPVSNRFINFRLNWSALHRIPRINCAMSEFGRPLRPHRWPSNWIVNICFTLQRGLCREMCNQLRSNC